MATALANTQFSKFPRRSPSLAKFFFNLPMIRYRPNLSALRNSQLRTPASVQTFIGHFYDRIELENPLSVYTHEARGNSVMFCARLSVCEGKHAMATPPERYGFQSKPESADSCTVLNLFVYCLPTPKVVVCCLSHRNRWPLLFLLPLLMLLVWSFFFRIRS